MSKPNPKNLDEDVGVVCEVRKDDRVGCRLLLADVLLNCSMVTSRCCQETCVDQVVETDVML